MRWLTGFCILFCSCRTGLKINLPERHSSLSGTAFYAAAAGMNWQARDSFVLREVLAGNLPDFLLRFVAIRVSIPDPNTGKTVSAVYYVSPDYLSIGQNRDWARVNITPMAAQQIADSLGCFLPTRKIVDDIYRAARVRPEPVPLYAYRDSTPTMWHHHLIIEGQRQGRKGLIAGIKKDVVISEKLARETRKDRVAIYGWHRPDGRPIQPLYTGHVRWWVDYSQGIRLVYRKIRVNGKFMDYTEILRHPVWRKLICDEEYCDFYRYDYP